jgi:hypothetical protein
MTTATKAVVLTLLIVAAVVAGVTWGNTSPAKCCATSCCWPGPPASQPGPPIK